MKQLKAIFTIVLISICLKTEAQEQCITPYWGDNIICLEEDKDFLWFGTKDDGLVRFDKESKEKLYINTSNSGLLSDNIQDLLYYNDELVISTSSGLCKYSSGSISTLSDTIQGLLLEDFENNLVVADCRENLKNDIHYFRSGILVKTISLVSDNFPLQNSGVTLTKDSSIWLVQNVFYNVDIYRIKGDTFSIYNNQNSAFRGPNPFGTSIVSKGDSVYLSLGEGLYLFDGDWAFKYQVWGYDDVPFITNEFDTINFRLTALSIDKAGVLWCGSLAKYGDCPNVSYQENNQWHILPKLGTQKSTVTDILPSKYDDRYVYMALNYGLYVVDKKCLEEISSVNEKDLQNLIKVFPNPSTGVYQFLGEFTSKPNGIVLVYNPSGKQVFSEKLSANKTINISHLPNGIYFLELDVEGELVRKKIVKE